MKYPSFLIEFSSPLVKGQARLVPSGIETQQYEGQSLYVEIDQEKVTDFRVRESGSTGQTVSPMIEAGTFEVHGVVESITPLSEPEGEQVIMIKVLEARFTLSRSDTQNATLSIGAYVSFTVHGLSLWDEAL
jgi:hypothetical protein